MERRTDDHNDRRRVPRGGRRTTDRPGRYPAILVAESYDGVRLACARYLQQFNFDVTEASNGEQALVKIVATSPHLILTEWNLPAMPAGKLAQWVAQRRTESRIPVIVLANVVEGDGVLPRVAGVLRKPFLLSEMIDEVRRVLRGAA
jgi:twitching motility two-component system response regulator PilH